MLHILIVLPPNLKSRMKCCGMSVNVSSPQVVPSASK